MNRLAIAIALALAFSTTAFGQDDQDVDNSSPVDRQAAETYYKNAVPPVPAAPLPPDRPADLRPKDTSGSADQQAAQTYRSNTLPPVPTTHHRYTAYRYSRLGTHHRHRHHRHHRRVHRAIVEPTTTMPPPN